MSDLNSEIIKKIKKIRIEKGLSQEKLSELSKLDPKYINKLENGRFNLTIPTLERILFGLEMTVLDFFDSGLIVEEELKDILETINLLENSQKKKILKKMNELIEVLING